MSAAAGWLLAIVALVAGWAAAGWQGLLLAITVVVFWLLLQFNRTVRVMRGATGRPIGHVDSAVMLNAKLRTGLAMWQVIEITRSLGRPLDDRQDHLAWRDEGGSEVRLAFRRGKLQSWALHRPAAAADEAPLAGRPPAAA